MNWERENSFCRDVYQEISIPNSQLDGVSFVDFHSEEDFEKIPAKSGTYWITTNEPIGHEFNNSKHPNPITTDDGNLTIIYNGVSGSGLRSRIHTHLKNKSERELGESGSYSGISVDIAGPHSKSHRKELSKSYTAGVKTSKDNFDPTSFTSGEQDMIVNNEKVFFKNGIDIFDPKHNPYLYRVYFIANINETYMSIIETRWRKECGSPILCTYQIR